VLEQLNQVVRHTVIHSGFKLLLAFGIRFARKKLIGARLIEPSQELFTMYLLSTLSLPPVWIAEACFRLCNYFVLRMKMIASIMGKK
jgi:hypothetical protein